MIHNIFGHSIFIKEFKDLKEFEPYRKSFTNQLIELSNSFIDYNNGEKRGNLITSVFSEETFKSFMGYNFLESIVKSTIADSMNLTLNKLSLSRTWYNINYKDSYVVSHIHNANIKILICILYLEAPENSGKLAIVNDKSKNLSCDEFEQNKVHYISIRPNMLICHLSDVNHAVSKHLSDDRRISILFEYLLE